MRFLLRFSGLVSLVMATIAGTIDSIQSVAASAVVMTSLAEAWVNVSPATFEKFQSTIMLSNSNRFFGSATQWLLLQPAFCVFLVIALLLWIVAYKRLPAAGRFAA